MDNDDRLVHPPVEPNDQEYGNMLLLEDLETLLEDSDDARLSDDLTGGNVPGELAERASALGVRSVNELRRCIAELHLRLDEQDNVD